jgi:hypothetical protein
MQVPRGASIPVPGPSAALVHDSARNVVVLLTGSQDPNMPITTWELDVATLKWTNRQPSPPPSTSIWPRSRNAFGAAYDARRGRTYLFGGYNLIYFMDFWEWDGVTGAWTMLTPNPAPANWPMNRYGVSLAYDADRGKLVLFGGVGLDTAGPGSLVHNDVWEWDATGSAWTNRTPDPVPAAWPAGRQSPSVVYDSNRKRVVIFGGDGGASPSISPARRADLWEWDGATGTWTNHTPSPVPSTGWPAARMAPAAAYDATRARMMVFGGDPLSQELWEWNPATSTWTDRTANPIPAAWPSQRYYSGMTFIPSTGRTLLWGGTGLSSIGIGYRDDLWSWQPPATLP